MGSHGDSIVGLAFQENRALTGPAQSSRDKHVAETTVDATTAEYKLIVAEETGNSSGGALTLSGKCGEKRLSVQSEHSGAGRVAKDQDSEVVETEGGEEEACFGLVLLSASMDGVIKAWEMLGKNEKYSMRHPGGVEVTSMLVLPGGSILVTGEIRLLAKDAARH